MKQRKCPKVRERSILYVLAYTCLYVCLYIYVCVKDKKWDIFLSANSNGIKISQTDRQCKEKIT